MFSSRTAWDLTPNRLTNALQARRGAGLGVIDLTEANPARCGLALPGSSILAAISSPGALAYEPDPRGLPRARAALAADYAGRGITLSPDSLFLTASTSEAYSFLFRLLADPGDAILVPSPSYPLFEHLAQIHDLRLVPYALAQERGFSPDVMSIERLAAESRARALLVVHPGNPTGSFLKRAEAADIVKLCSSMDIAILSDEVFGDYAHVPDPDRCGSLAGTGEALTFTLNGLSKMLALPQLKLGWIAVSGPPGQAREAMQRLEVIADTFLSVGTPVQAGLESLLELRPAIQSVVGARLRDNLAELALRLRVPGPCRLLPCEGGWNAILQVPRSRSDEDWAVRLLEADGVLVHPGYLFEFSGEGHLVVSLLCEPARFSEGMRALLARVSEEA